MKLVLSIFKYRYFVTQIHGLFYMYGDIIINLTDERESPQKASPARENSSLGFIEAVHQ